MEELNSILNNIDMKKLFDEINIEDFKKDGCCTSGAGAGACDSMLTKIDNKLQLLIMKIDTLSLIIKNKLGDDMPRDIIESSEDEELEN